MAAALRWYYQHMTRAEQSVYDLLLSGFENLKLSIRIPRMDMRELSELFFRLRLDHPMIFHVVSFSCRGVPGSDYVDLIPEYIFDRSKIIEQRKAITSRVDRLTRPMAAMTDAEKELAIHDFICENVTYDKLKKPYSHEVIGPLTNGVGVCEGIAKTVKLLCDALGMECMIAICDADPDNGSKYRHAWNVLKIDGKYTHLDVTFDNTLGKAGPLRYDYFNLSDSHIFRDHRPLMYPAPACTDSGLFYYKVKKLSFTKPEDVENRIRQALRKKKSHYLFHWRGGYLTREVITDLAARIVRAAEEKGQYVSISVNFPQAVVLVRFEAPSGEGLLTAENPDESDESA